MRRQHGADLDPNRDDYNKLSGVFRISVKDDSGHTLFSGKWALCHKTFDTTFARVIPVPEPDAQEIANLRAPK